MSEAPSKYKVLMDLRTALTGFSGISQETRLLFSSFQNSQTISVQGMINRDLDFIGKALPRGKSAQDIPPLLLYNRLSRFLFTLHKQDLTPVEKIKRYLLRRYDALWLSLRGRLGLREALTHFEPGAFEDCVWEEMFSKSLPASDWHNVTTAQYMALSVPYFSMHHAGLVPGGSYPIIDTSGFDAMLCPNPYPARVAPETQMIIRYHDAIPMLYPQFIPNARFHQRSHSTALKLNSRSSLFVCTTDAVRKDLVGMLPEVEERSCTIHDMVSHNYYIAPLDMRQVCEIIRTRISRSTAPAFENLLERRFFYDRHLKQNNVKYLLYVSVVEPRKNHQRLMRAFETLLAKGFSDLKLVIVGHIGEGVEKLVDGMKALQQRGRLFHLTNLSSDELRVMYAGAACTICPSLAEGFDLSGIESMLSGGVVAASDNDVHREVYQDSVAYFQPYSVSEQAKAIESIIHPDRAAFRDAMRLKGQSHAQQYSRERIVAKWENYFESLRLNHKKTE